MTITVSQGPGKIYIPNVIGKDSGEATKELTNLSFLVSLRDEPNLDFPSGSVIQTEPEVGKAVDPESNVIIIVSNGPPLVEVPDVQNLQIDSAPSFHRKRRAQTRINII